jgi:4-hydroxy-2-oxoglutarate aldolase
MGFSIADCRGAWVPLVTPFRSDGGLDLEALAALAERLAPAGIAGFLVLGTTGEAAHCDMAESEAVVRTVVRAAGGLPVLAGSGRPTTRHTIEATERLAAAGAVGVLVLTPHAYRSRMDGAAFRDHYAAVAAAARLPVFVYHMPGATGVDLEAAVLRDCVRVPNIWGFKDSSTEAGPLAATLAEVETHGFVGSAPRICEALQAGACGAIVAIANLVPDLCARIVGEWSTGRHDAARALQPHLTAVSHALSGWGTAAVKAGLEIQGWPVGKPRAPLRLPPRAVYGALESALAAARRAL